MLLPTFVAHLCCPPSTPTIITHLCHPLSSPTFIAYLHCPPLLPTFIAHLHRPPSSPTIIILVTCPSCSCLMRSRLFVILLVHGAHTCSPPLLLKPHGWWHMFGKGHECQQVHKLGSGAMGWGQERLVWAGTHHCGLQVMGCGPRPGMGWPVDVGWVDGMRGLVMGMLSLHS